MGKIVLSMRLLVDRHGYKSRVIAWKYARSKLRTGSFLALRLEWLRWQRGSEWEDRAKRRYVREDKVPSQRAVAA